VEDVAVFAGVELALALAAAGEVVVGDVVGVGRGLRVGLAVGGGPDTVGFLDGLEVGAVGFHLDYAAW